MKKVQKIKVQYQNGPRGKQKCSGCTMWVPPNKCTAVEGMISNEGWCNLYEKAGKKA